MDNLQTKVTELEALHDDIQKTHALLEFKKGKYDEALSGFMKELGYKENDPIFIPELIRRSMEKGKDLPRLIV